MESDIIEMNQSRREYKKNKLKHKKARKVFEGCITREQCYKLAERYLKFLSERSKKKSLSERKNMVFRLNI